MSEIIDVIDENDNIIGKEERSVCHKEGLRHRGVGTIVINSNGNILVERRSVEKITNPGKLGIIGGHIDSGESYEDAVKREVEEEIGVRGDIRFLFQMNWKEDKGDIKEREICKIFLLKHDGPFNIDKEEIQEVMFFSPKELKKVVEINDQRFGGWSKKLLRIYFERFN